MNSANPQRADARWPGRRSRPTSTRTGGRTRPVLAVILLILLALIGGYSALFVYGFQDTYSDPLVSDLDGLGEIAHGFVFAAVVLIGVAALAVGMAREGTRHLVGIADGSLNQEFRNIDHPGYFYHPGYVGGGSTSRTDCTFLLTTSNIASALAAYDERLTMMGYQVTRAKTSLTATRDGFEFTATAGAPSIGVVGPPGSTPTVVPPGDASPAHDDLSMTVTLRDTR